MAPIHKEDPSPAYAETVNEIMKTYKSLPPRPSIEELEAAIAVVKTVTTEEQLRLDEISKQIPPQDVPPELFSVLLQVRKSMVLFMSHEQRKEALNLIETDEIFQRFDELIRRASDLLSGVDSSDAIDEIEIKIVGSDEGLIKKEKFKEPKAHEFKGLASSSSSSQGGESMEKMNLMDVASLIEKTAKIGAKVVDLEAKLMDKIEWLPLSLGKLLNITDLNLSNNRIMALPSTIDGLRALKTLDIHSNQLINLPESIGELQNLSDLDLHANMLKSLPNSFRSLKNLLNLDLSSNNFTHLPDLIGELDSLKRLIVETNDLEDVPSTIGSCSSLVELRLDFNQIKGLPEAIGKLECLEILTLHYNRVKRLPTTMGNLLNLREVDVSFNEIESIPESLCSAISLEKLNLGKNFADLRELPKSIGNLEKLEELDISDNQIKILPDSFVFLSKLRVFRADETPLEVPARQVAKLGAQAVVEYMVDFVAKRDMRSQQPKKKKGFYSRVCPLFCLLG